jgi:hypothetical protein
MLAHRYWYFGVEQCIDRLMADPATGKHILLRSARSTPDTGSYFNSPAYKMLNEDCAGALSQSNICTVLLTLGGDGVQLVNWGSRTATVVGLKCEDMPPELAQKGQAVKPLLVIEGPQEPSVLNHALQAVAKFFHQHAPSSNGSGICSPLSQTGIHPNEFCGAHIIIFLDFHGLQY